MLSVDKKMRKVLFLSSQNLYSMIFIHINSPKIKQINKRGHKQNHIYLERMEVKSIWGNNKRHDGKGKL